MNGVRIEAPAKVNLGLAVLGKRPDGYHEIDTIMAMIELADVLRVVPSDDGISIHGMDDVPVESNLVTRAIRRYCDHVGMDPAFEVAIEKHIPSPAGLGGGSSDAAATLLALNALQAEPLPDSELREIAATIGADCPFFLGTPAARATGTGTDLHAIPSPSGWVVFVVPPAEVTAKTATLYASLQVNDYLSSAHIDGIQRALANGAAPQLVNSFTRAARESFPALDHAWEVMEDIAGTCALSGAGPAVYALAAHESQALAWRDELASRLPDAYPVYSSRFLAHSPKSELLP